jgi:hypothetical protein
LYACVQWFCRQIGQSEFEIFVSNLVVLPNIYEYKQVLTKMLTILTTGSSGKFTQSIWGKLGISQPQARKLPHASGLHQARTTRDSTTTVGEAQASNKTSANQPTNHQPPPTTNVQLHDEHTPDPHPHPHLNHERHHFCALFGNRR